MALHLPNGPLKTRSGLKPASRSEPSTYEYVPTKTILNSWGRLYLHNLEKSGRG